MPDDTTRSRRGLWEDGPGVRRPGRRRGLALVAAVLVACGGDPDPAGVAAPAEDAAPDDAAPMGGAPAGTGPLPPPEAPRLADDGPADVLVPPADLPEPPERGPWFVAGSPELDHRNLAGPTAAQGKRYLRDCIGPGVTTADLDDDGRLDLYFPQGRGDGDPRNVAYRNLGGRRFERVPDAWGADDDGYSFAALAFDLDLDGDLDLLSTNQGRDRLYRNDGGAFTDVTAEHPDVAGSADDWSTGAAAADVDLDGDLDVYVARYVLHDAAALDAQGWCRFMGCEVPCGPRGLTAQADLFLANAGAPGFTLEDATDAAGLGDVKASYAFQPVFSDVDDDGDLDLYVSNDSVQNFLFLNDGAGRFREDAVLAGVGHGDAGNPEAGMGVSVVDADGDALPEILVTNFSTQSNSFYRNLSEEDFVWFREDAHQVDLGYPTFFLLSWGCALADFDCDGLVDVFSANGHVFPQVDDCPPDHIVYRQANSLFAGRPGPDLRFEDLGAAAGAPFAMPAGFRGSAAADLDDDGAMDLVVVRLDGAPLMAWNDSRGRGHWLALTVERPGDAPGAPWTHAVGARATVTAGGRRWTREAVVGSSFLATEDPRLHVGLGDATRVDLVVRFPDGHEQRWEDVAADRHLRVRRGVDDLEEVPRP